MKTKIYASALLAIAAVFSVSAQEETSGNRMIVNLTSGHTVAYSTDSITNITFEEVGDVDVKLSLTDTSANSLSVECLKSDDCYSVYMGAVPASTIDAGADLAALVKKIAKTPTVLDDTSVITLGGLTEQTEYTVIALAVDKWGIDGSLSTLNASTTAVPVTNLNMVFDLAYEGDKYNTGSGYFTLSLMTVHDAENLAFEALNIEGFMPLDAGAALAEGTYTFESNEDYTGNPFTFLSQHNVGSQSFGTYFMSTADGGSEYYIPAAGSIITVEKNDDGYVITANMINVHGEKRTFVYSGAVEFPVDTKLKFEGSFQQAEALSAGKYVGQETEQIAVTLTGINLGSDGDMSQCQMVLMFYTDSASEIPSGTYNLVAEYEKSPFTLQPGFFLGMGMPNPCYMYNVSQYRGENIVILDKGGSVTVSKNGDQYTLDIKLLGTDLVSSESAAANYTYTGIINIK